FCKCRIAVTLLSGVPTARFYFLAFSATNRQPRWGKKTKLKFELHPIPKRLTALPAKKPIFEPSKEMVSSYLTVFFSKTNGAYKW
ncbi:MAG: hypothetical protein H7334_14415, partial [Ferruginibacter sp.]|nr:hypothetical protein [Ferruginibacter sp.]